MFFFQDKNDMFKESVFSSELEGGYLVVQEDNFFLLENLIGVEKRNGYYLLDESRLLMQIDEYEMK